MSISNENVLSHHFSILFVLLSRWTTLFFMIFLRSLVSTCDVWAAPAGLAEQVKIESLPVSYCALKLHIFPYFFFCCYFPAGRATVLVFGKQVPAARAVRKAGMEGKRIQPSDNL